MGQGEENKPLGECLAATGLQAFIQTANGFLEPTGAKECCT